MPRKLSDKTIKLIKQSYADNLPVIEIARRAKVSYPTVYGYTKLRQRIDPERGKPFESLSQLYNYQARQRINPETGELFESYKQYQEYQARQRIDPETGELFESYRQYQEYQARQRQERAENQELSNLIERRLKKLGKNQSWLAEKIRVTRQAVSLYVKGKSVPSEEVLCNLYSALKVPYQTLDDLLK